jgi:hypothetical protein
VVVSAAAGGSGVAYEITIADFAAVSHYAMTHGGDYAGERQGIRRAIEIQRSHRPKVLTKKSNVLLRSVPQEKC